ncbi:hypothetical protein ED733_003630 [Metarhizium rileyi]|uniref:non-specific serine/threonine protein kinase n=1 Tax=Metarhizium rileyi (strain RCEF 4871) TaxID=1649241 RepID=A0A5C6G457_METRR|nr:hypothetical protein ED733_003630 [Metarhizium rileyi]
MNNSNLLEEERLPWYSHDQFYPVRIGETLAAKYQVVGKLGYGANSTSWLCRDNSDSTFVAVKVCTRDSGKSPRLRRELEFYHHVSSLNSQHPGQRFIRGLYETFEIPGPSGQHLCLVHPPMHMTINELQYINPARRLNQELLKLVLFNLLNALSFLHDEAEVTHADINASNIMLTLDDESLLIEFEQSEASDPLPIKIIDDVRTIYTSRKLGLPKDALWGQPVLCDFGEARIGERHRGLIQPELYRAPEVLFNMDWDTSADIWNLAVLIWDLFENRHLFNAMDEEKKSSATHHIAEMVSYIGLPPLEYIDRSAVTKNVFDDNGQWKGAGGATIQSSSLEDMVTVLDGQAKEQFLRFVRSMLRWQPETRKRASELLRDPWMKGSLTNSEAQ